MAAARPKALHLCREGEPLPDPYEEVEGAGRAARPVLLASARARAHPWAGALPIAPAMAAERRTLRYVPARPAAPPAARRRVPRAVLVRRRDLHPACAAPRRALPARHGRLRIGDPRGWPIRVRAVSRASEVQRPLSRRRTRTLGRLARRPRARGRAGLRVLQQRHRRTRAAGRDPPARFDRGEDLRAKGRTGLPA